MATTTNYTTNGVTRKVDLYVMGELLFDSTAKQQTQMTLASESGGKVCAGVVKIAQKVVVFMLSLGQLYSDNWGTSLTAMLLSYSQFQIEQQFSLFISDVVGTTITQLKAQESSTDPSDEQINNLYVTDWNFDKYNGMLTLNLQLSMMSGATMPIVVPISIVP